MTVRKLPDGQWLSDFRPNGHRGKRYRKIFATKHEATAFEAHIMQQKMDKPWLGEKRDSRRLTDLITLWYNSHGISLGDGTTRKEAMAFMADHMGDPVATAFSATDFAEYRKKRLDGVIYRRANVKKVSPRMVNLELAYVRAMFNTLIEQNEWAYANPVLSIKEMKTHESEMTYLTVEEIKTLFDACSVSKTDVLLVTKLALATGARWREAEEINLRQIKKGMVTYIKTKGLKNRSLPISEQLYSELMAKAGNKKSGRLFSTCYEAFEPAIKRAKIDLPKGQLTHVLRHTFASHFMINGGNLLVLQKALGHTDIKMTMRYAHLAPDHLSEVLLLNPLDRLTGEDESND